MSMLIIFLFFVNQGVIRELSIVSPWKKVKLNQKQKAHVPPRSCTKTFTTARCMFLQPYHVLGITTNPVSGNGLCIIPLKLHGRAHCTRAGRRSWMKLTAQLKDGNTCLQTPGECLQCSVSALLIPFLELLMREFFFFREATQRLWTNLYKDPICFFFCFFPLSFVKAKQCKGQAGGASFRMRYPSSAQRTDSAVPLRASHRQPGERAARGEGEDRESN